MSKHVTEPALAVDVRELLQQPGAHKHVVLRAVLPDLATPVASVPPEQPVHIDAELESVVEGLLVTGKVRATVRLRCVRCLRGFDHELEVDVRELFALHPREEEDEGYTVLPDDRLPLDTMVRDALVLAFPSFPLCRPDCAGLCPRCGADRNSDGFARRQDNRPDHRTGSSGFGDARTRLTDCGHGAPGATDPRWAALAGLRQALEEEHVARPEA
jgi:uncharacterized protein